MHIKLHFLDQILYLRLHETVSICDVWSGKKRERYRKMYIVIKHTIFCINYGYACIQTFSHSHK